MNTRRLTISAILFIIIALFAIYVWPTRYMYMYFSNEQIPVRLDRFTDKAEWLLPDQGWVNMNPKPKTIADPAIAPSPINPFDKFSNYPTPSFMPSPTSPTTKSWADEINEMEKSKNSKNK